MTGERRDNKRKNLEKIKTHERRKRKRILGNKNAQETSYIYYSSIYINNSYVYMKIKTSKKEKKKQKSRKPTRIKNAWG